MLKFAVMTHFILEYVGAMTLTVMVLLAVYYAGQWRAMQKLDRARKLNSPAWQNLMREEAMEVARLAQEIDQATAEKELTAAQNQSRTT